MSQSEPVTSPAAEEKEIFLERSFVFCWRSQSSAGLKKGLKGFSDAAHGAKFTWRCDGIKINFIDPVGTGREL